MNSIVLRIRENNEPQANESTEGEKNSGLVLELLDASGAIQASERIPGDLKLGCHLPCHSGDYTTYREFFLRTQNQNRKFSDIGRHLFDVLHLGDVGRKWDELARTEVLRVLLDIETSARGENNVALLPWELIFDGTQRRFQELDTPIVRIRNYKEEDALLVEKIKWPIRLLIVVGVNDPRIAASEEVEGIEDALRKNTDEIDVKVNRLIDIEVMDSPPTIDELEERCKSFKPHIFHYIGHGGVDSDRNPHVRLKGPSGADDPWSASDIKISLPAWDWIPRFAFINACRTSGGASTGDQLGAWGISDAFNSLRVPAVLTMQANIDGKLAGTFAGTLYEHLALGDCIDRALAFARAALRQKTSGNRDNRRDWATPTLTISLPPEKILSFELKTTEQRKEAIKNCARFREVDTLANCKDERRSFIYGFYPIRPLKSEKNLVLVRGDKESGKTWVTLWCLEACALLAHNVRHVEVVSGESPKWLDVLRQIQAGDTTKAVANQVIYAPLEEKAFYEFNHELHHRIKKKQIPPPWDGTAFPFEKDLDLSELDNLPPDTVKNIFTSFRKALRNAAEQNNPLIIVLDQWSHQGYRIAADHMDRFLIPHLFAKAAAGDLNSPDGRSVRFVLVMNDEELDKLYPQLLEKLEGSFHEVHLQGIPGDQFEKVAKEFFRNLGTAKKPGISRSARILINKYPDLFIDEFRPHRDDVWQPNLLRRMVHAAENFCKA